jgi:magnesium chelatase family protein
VIFSKVHSAQNQIINAEQIDIETDISNGLYSFNIIGLADKAVEESKDRISAALKNSGFKSPKKSNQKVVISLAPANIHKSGPHFDLPMAVGYLKSIGEIKKDISNTMIVGELSLDGCLKKISGILPIVILAKQKGFKEIFIPEGNKSETIIIKGINIFTFNNLKEVTDYLKGRKKLLPSKNKVTEPVGTGKTFSIINIKGQDKAKRGLQIAASGGHNLAFYGPPGTGKTLLARSIVDILPALNYDQTIETTSIHSVLGENNGLIQIPPFRNPHHTSSHSSIIGGGAYLKPGEISLAHNGVLFLDEMAEFSKKTIDSLRQPLEDGYISLSRLNQRIKIPSNFILLVSMNPCPCGYYKSKVKKCTCSTNSIERYRKKISGPIVDRIDMWIEINNIQYKNLLDQTSTNEILEINKIINSITRSREIQQKRFSSDKLNTRMSPGEITKYCILKNKEKKLLNNASDKLNLSVRSYHKIIKLSRTIADLDRSENISSKHILEALQYRPLF